MKTYRTIIFALALCWAGAFVFTGCQQPPSQRVVAVQTLETAGLSAKAALDGSAILLAHGVITVPQWDKVATLYYAKFQPAYNAALLAVNSDLSSFSSPDIIALAAELTNLVATYSK